MPPVKQDNTLRSHWKNKKQCREGRKMKAISARATLGINLGAYVIASDNSGAKIVKVVSVKRWKGRKGRQAAAKIADWVKVSVRKGNPEMKGKVFDAIVIRLKRAYRRRD